MRKVNVLQSVLLGWMLVMVLGGCHKNEGKSSSQVAAKVDDSEISVLQVNQVISNTPNVTAENVPELRKKALEKLVDQQVILNKAYEDGLDRTPEVMVALEAAKREVVARAYLSKLVSSKVRLANSDLQKYYDEHAELFAQRRIYSLQDIGLGPDFAKAEELSQVVIKNPSIQEVAAWLRDNGVQFTAASYTKPAEQISTESLEKLKDMQVGDIALVHADGNYHVLRVVNAAPAPMDFQKAQPLIKSYLTNTRGQKVVLDEVSRLKGAAKVEYYGNFTDVNAKAVTAEKPASTNTPSDTKTDSIKKGITGLN